MQSFAKIIGLLSLALCLGQTVQAQKKVITFRVEKVIPHPAEKVWAVVGEDYGAIANSHPKIIASDYVSGTLQAGEGAERVCYFNEKGSQFLKEKMTNYNPREMTFVNKVYQAGRVPVNPDYTQAVYRVERIDANTSRFIFDMQYRTKPALMGAMMKGQFRQLIDDYAVAIEHYISTGEQVTKKNFKTIRKLFAAN